MFAFVSAFPKSLHCTDEAQQAETVLSAVLSIYTQNCVYTQIFSIFNSSPFQSIYMFLAALVWGSDRGGPVGEAEKTGGCVFVAHPKLKRDG